jgi:hypothetical protein
MDDMGSACEAEHPYGSNLYVEDNSDFEDDYNVGRIEDGGEPGVKHERRGGEKWNVWHHGGDGRWENHVALKTSYGVDVNGLIWSYEDYDGRVEEGTVSEAPQFVTGPVAAYGVASYAWKPLANATSDLELDEFAASQESMRECLDSPETRSPSQKDLAGKRSRSPTTARDTVCSEGKVAAQSEQAGKTPSSVTAGVDSAVCVEALTLEGT